MKPGSESSWKRTGTLRHGMRAYWGIYLVTVPVFTVITRKNFGMAGQATANVGSINYRVGWPSGDWGSLPIEGGVAAAFKREIESAPDPDKRRLEIEARLLQFRNPFRTAEAFGIAEGALEALVEDAEAVAGIDGKMRVLLRYVKKLTETPARMTEGDADPVYAAGWDETALFHAVSICALFNFMNRLVSSLGIEADAAYLAEAGPRLKEVGYSPSLARVLEED